MARKKQLDNESKIILGEAKQLRNLFAQTGWAIVEREYDNLVREISDIRTLEEGLSTEDKINAIDARQAGLKLFEELFRRIKGNSEIKEKKEKTDNLVKYHQK